MFKLNFEKTAIFVLALIICISSANIYSQFYSQFFNRKAENVVQTNVAPNISFPASLLRADQLHEQGMFKEAQSEYLKLTNMSNLSSQQKATVHFKLGVCNYRLQKYDMARDSFLKSAEFNVGDPVAYNNAAVSSFYLNDLARAEELQKKAIASLPVIEYQYNMARIYEASNRYIDSVKYYTAVVKGEENITREDRIDPVRVKNKVMKLMTDLDNAEEVSNELMIALRLKDTREVFIIDDIDMDIKDKNFKWRIAKENGMDKLYCSYDRKESDPYNLIDSLKWTVRSGGKTVYTSSKDNFSLLLADRNSYIVNLDINYNTNKQAKSYVDIASSSSAYSDNTNPTTIPAANPANEKCRYYEYAVYEQVFEKGFNVSGAGYVDRFGTEWGKDDIEVRVMEKDFIDAQSALYINNEADRRAGIWANLSSLIADKQLRGKTIGIKLYARRVSSNANLYINIRTKLGKTYKNTSKRYQLESNYKWKLYDFNMQIPENADGLTLSFKTDSGEEIKIDGFIINIVK